MMRLTKRSTLLVILLFVVIPKSVFADDLTANALSIEKATVDEKQKVDWYNAQDLTIEGIAWEEAKPLYNRFPKKAESSVRKSVWYLSTNSAGVCVKFNSDARAFHARWKLKSSKLAMEHMAATGVSGLDLYVRHDDGTWRWLGSGRPKAQTTTGKIVSGLIPGTREYMLYLPLYNGVTSVEIGVNSGAKIAPAAVRKEKPFVFYGTSITQGGCASRTGMVHTSILGRRFDRPVINLGFSGNGRMEAEVAELMTEIDAEVFIIDCLPNISAGDVKVRTEPLVKILRAKHPQTPILLVEDRTYTNAFLVPSKQDRHKKSRAALMATYKKLKSAGDKNLYYIEGEKLLNPDGEGTVDSSHPTDLGFVQHADAFEVVLKKILNN